MVQLRDVESGTLVGTVTDDQLRFLIDQLEEESRTDQDYYIDAETLAVLEAAGADPALMTVLHTALGMRESMDVHWNQVES